MYCPPTNINFIKEKNAKDTKLMNTVLAGLEAHERGLRGDLRALDRRHVPQRL